MSRSPSPKNPLFEVIFSFVKTTRPLAPKTRKEALEQSVAKWEFVLELVQTGGDLPDDGGGATCGLCRFFCVGAKMCERDGQRCPVAAETGHSCGCTPYDAYQQARYHGNSAAALEAAKAELRFLRRLLRKEEQGANRVQESESEESVFQSD